jgi:hypothetical protein
MKNNKSKKLIEVRLRFDWIVLLLGIFCVLIQVISNGDLTYFAILLCCFVFIEGFGVELYKKLLSGGEGYHMHSSQNLNQTSSFELILFCMIFDFFIFFSVIAIFLLNALKNI